MMFMVKWVFYVLGWPIRSLHTILSYCLAPRISVLLIIVLLLWICAARRECSCDYHERCASEVCPVCLHAHLPACTGDAPDGESAGAVKVGFQTLFMPDRADDFGGMAIYLVVWLIGGGVLVSSILSTSSRFRAGFWRKWPWTVGGHIVILGWDDNVPTRIQEYLKRKNARKLIPESFYVLTTADVAKVRRALDSIFKWYLPIRYYVYQGSYTNPAELRKLRIYRAHEVFVVGEETDAAHDSTVRMIPSLLEAACKSCSESKWNEKWDAICNLDRFWNCFFGSMTDESTLICHVTISNFGLFHVLNGACEQPVAIGDRKMIVRHDNFHNNWARRLLTRWKSDTPQVDLQGQQRKLIIISFGAMGKAFAVVAHKVAPELEIVVVGDRDANKDPSNERETVGRSGKLAYELDRFEAQFGWAKEQVPRWNPGNFVTLDPKSFCDEYLCAKSQEKVSKLTIAICIKRSDKGLLWAMEIANWLSQNRASDKVELLLCQEIGGNASDRIGDDSDMIMLNQCRVRLFGMKDGAGFEEKFCADECRNPDTEKLRAYAAEVGAALARDCGIDGARWVLGGSLAYDAALVGCYDIDLRLLLPESPDVRDRINAVKDLLVRRADGDPTFEAKFIDEGGKNYIWHTKRMIKVPGLSENADVELSWNIQSEKSYRSIAEMAARFPREVIDRYVVAKWNAWMKGGNDYKTLKEKWKKLVNWAIDRNVHELSLKGRELSDDQLAAILKSVAEDFPEFLG